MKKILPPKNIKKPASKVAHNPTRPRVVIPAIFCFVENFFSLSFLIFEVVKLCRMNLESLDST